MKAQKSSLFRCLCTGEGFFFCIKDKVLIEPACGTGNFLAEVLRRKLVTVGKPFYGAPNTACTETYLVIGPFADEKICRNVMSYIATKFFRFLVLLRKPSQHATSKVYGFVPIQDFSKCWTDEELYTKYGLTDEEIAFIDSMIRPMDLNGGDN